MSDLKQTYAQSPIHTEWESIYRTQTTAKFNNDVTNWLLAMVRPKPGSVFLDAGCGFRHHTRRICEAGFSCVGVDISEVAIDIARSRTKRHRASFFCGALESLSLPNESFDYVHCRGVLMHVPRMKDSIRELVRVIKPGGKIVIMDNHSHCLETMLIRVIRKFRVGKSRMVKNGTGIEFWSTENGEPFLVRYPHIEYIRSCLNGFGVQVNSVSSYELFDLGRFPKSFLTIVSAANRAAFPFKVPLFLSHGIVILGTKVRTVVDG